MNERRVDLRETITEACDRRTLNRFAADPVPLTGMGALDYRPLLTTDSLPERMAQVWNLDYTPEELAIEAEEAMEAEEAQERMGRAELEAERPYYRTRGEL